MRYFCATLIAAATALVAGCPQQQTSAPSSRSQQEELRQHDRGEALVDAAIRQLGKLSSAVDMELRPPNVILDASQSANGEDVMAVCIPNPNAPDGPINIISVPAQNSRFRNLRIRPGDVLKYYIIEDETVDEQRREEGLARQLAKELTVAQVLDDNTLIIEGSLPQPELFPQKLEVWRYSDERLADINRQLVIYHERRLPPIGWEPSPDAQALKQIETWLNQWLRQSEPKVEWQRDKLLDTLDAQLAADKDVTAAIAPVALAAQKFEPNDPRLLQEAVWLRDIARWAQGDNFNDLARATALFDWTIRNIQLDADDGAATRRPWQVLLHGHGTAEQRAWLFALLARQQGLDVVMLRIAEGEGQRAEGQQQTSGPQPSALSSQPSDPQSPAPSPQPRWLPAVVLNQQLYLFDSRLGLPIPGPKDEGVATLDQVRQDDALLRQLDVEGSPYPLNAEAFKNVEAYIVADPFDLSWRSRLLESKLAGDDNLVLTSAPSHVAEQLKDVPGISAVKLWDVPFRTLRDQLNLGITARHREALAFEPFAHRPGLWKARVLHFQGRKAEAEKGSLDEATDDHRDAAALYTSKNVRPTDRQIQRTSSSEKRRVDTTAKLGATYWIGLMSYDDGKYDVAADWLGRPELAADDSPWAAGARYNLARAQEARSNFAEAAKLLDEDKSPQQHGNQVRARRLKAQAEAEAAKQEQSNQ
jgi:hypothetical protein